MAQFYVVLKPVNYVRECVLVTADYTSRTNGDLFFHVYEEDGQAKTVSVFADGSYEFYGHPENLPGLFDKVDDPE